MSITSRTRAALWRVPVGLQLSGLYTLLLVAILALLGWALYSQLDRFLVQNTADRLTQAARSVSLRNLAFERGSHRQPSRSFSPPGAPGGAGSVGVHGDLGGQPLPSASFPNAPDPSRAVAIVSVLLVRSLSAPDVTVGVLDEQGSIITSTQTLNGALPRILPDLPAGWIKQALAAADTAATAQEAPRWVVPNAKGGRSLVVAEPFSVLEYAGAPAERLFLLQATPLDAADAVLGQLRFYLALGVLIGAIVGVLAGLVLTRAVLRPLDSMARTAEAIAAGDLNRRLLMPAGGNEVARVGGAFDHMVDRLASTLQAQRRFIADASHELRTPLTSLEGLSEMLLIGADRGDPGAVQRMARSMHSELGRMARLVSDLLTLSRLDSVSSMTFMPIDLGKLLREVAEQMEPLAEQRQVTLRVGCSGIVMVQAEPDRLKQVILNLVDNALRYTPADGEISLLSSHDSSTGTARLEVQDTGPGIAPADLPHIFDRFYRGDPSRARSSGNTGLGLAIVRAIVLAHGGTIEVQSPPGSGAHFTVALPPAQADKPKPPLPGKREREAVGTQV
ncbi:MAG: HAMP domain-containing histidine kinase [Chloroflexota bacterium]|nr:HAMP domain-containing histidine kinase [Chloroflexota bacterium]